MTELQEKDGLEDEVELWEGPPITLTHPYDRFWGGFVSQTFMLPAICHPRVRSAAGEVLQAQAKLRDLQGQRAAREQQKAELIRTGTGHEVAIFNADSEILDGRDIPNAIEAEQQAWQAFSAAFWGARGETRQFVLGELPSARQAAQTSIEAALTDLRRLQELNDVFDGAGTIHADENDPQAVQARFQREERRAAVAKIAGGTDLGSEGRIYGLLEIVSEYDRALNPPPVEPEPEPEIETEEQRQERAWKRMQGVPEEPAAVGVGRPAREFPG